MRHIRIPIHHSSFVEAMMDKGLAKLGDAYVNFLYSLATSQREGKPTGIKVNNRILAEALRRAGLRDLLPGRMSRHDMGNAAEALIAYAWLTGAVTLEECLGVLKVHEEAVDAFTDLLQKIAEKLDITH